jgi:hypothetical protein
MFTKLVTPYHFGNLKHYGGQCQLGMLGPDTVYWAEVKVDIVNIWDITGLGKVFPLLLMP